MFLHLLKIFINQFHKLRKNHLKICFMIFQEDLEKRFYFCHDTHSSEKRSDTLQNLKNQQISEI